MTVLLNHHDSMLRIHKSMNRLFAMLIALMFALNMSAQNAKFGKPSQDEWNLTSVDFEPNAPAVVLYKSVDVNYKISSEFNSRGDNAGGDLSDDGLAQMGTTKFYSPSMTTTSYDIKLRTKILTDAGREYAAIDIVRLYDKEDMDMRDEIYDMSVVVYSNVNGKIKKKRLSDSDYKEERINDYYVIRHVRIPEVKVGDIIEYKYTLFSCRSTFIYNTQMQENIPMLYAKCKMEIPYFLQFNVNTPQISLFKASAAQGSIVLPEGPNSLQIPRKCTSNVFTIEGEKIPSYEGVIDQEKIAEGKVLTVRTELKDKTYDVKPELYGSVRHLIIGK